MKYLVHLIFFIPSIAFSQFESSKQIFESPNLKTITTSHRMIAILPFDATISYRKQPKNFSLEANREQEVTLSKTIQGSMYTYLLRRIEEYTVDLQNVHKTNLLLKKAGMEGRLNEYTKEEIAAALGVDGILGGSFVTEHTQSDGLALASIVLLHGTGGRTATRSLTLTLTNGSDGELLWRFYKSMDNNLIGSTEDLVERMMRKVSRNFPYLN